MAVARALNVDPLAGMFAEGDRQPIGFMHAEDAKMADDATPEALARTWIEGWIAGEPQAIPLAEGFVHVSPFGTIEGRAAYLEFMRPMIGKGPSLEIVRTLGGRDAAVVWYAMGAPSGSLPCCDWVEVADGEIQRVTSFYDATSLRP